MQKDVMISMPIGTWNEGLENSVDREYYAAKLRWFPTVNRQVLQVLTECLGEFVWINVEQHWCTPQKK